MYRATKKLCRQVSLLVTWRHSVFEIKVLWSQTRLNICFHVKMKKYHENKNKTYLKTHMLFPFSAPKSKSSPSGERYILPFKVQIHLHFPVNTATLMISISLAHCRDKMHTCSSKHTWIKGTACWLLPSHIQQTDRRYQKMIQPLQTPLTLPWETLNPYILLT